MQASKNHYKTSRGILDGWPANSMRVCKHGLILSSVENAYTWRQHGFGNAINAQYRLVSRRVVDHILMIAIPRKGSLPLSSSSMKLSERCISFSVNKNPEADETSGILLRVSSTYRLKIAGILFCFFSFSSINAFAISGPRGEPMATPSTCSYKFLSKWKGWFFVAISNSSIRSVFSKSALVGWFGVDLAKALCQ